MQTSLKCIDVLFDEASDSLQEMAAGILAYPGDRIDRMSVATVETAIEQVKRVQALCSMTSYREVSIKAVELPRKKLLLDVSEIAILLQKARSDAPVTVSSVSALSRLDKLIVALYMLINELHDASELLAA